MSSRSTRRTPWRFEVWDILTRQYAGTLPMNDVEFNRPLNAAGKLKGTLRPGERLDKDTRGEWSTLVRFERAWIFARHGRIIPWSGQIVSGPWRGGSMEVGAVESRGWLDEIHLSVGRTPSQWSQVEQFRVVREAVAAACQRLGAPQIVPDTAVSGVLIDAQVEGQAFKPVGEFVTELAERERGFDWGVGARESSGDGKPELHLIQRYPEWDQGAPPTVHLISTPDVANVLGRPELPRDASGRRTVVYATGDGQAPDQAVAVDVDPLVEAGQAVRREAVSSYSGVAEVAVLAEHAHTERVASAGMSGTLQVEVRADNPDFTTYDTGSRVRFTVQDEFNDVVLPGVRVVERTVRCARRDGADSVTLSLDLADTELPDGMRL